MGIAWKYLDKKSAAADAAKDYGSMKFIIKHTDDEIKAAYEKMGGISSPQFDGMPHAHNPHAAEDRMAEGMDRSASCGSGTGRQWNTWRGSSRHERSFRRMTAMCWMRSTVRTTITAAARRRTWRTASGLSGRQHTGGRTGRWQS